MIASVGEFVLVRADAAPAPNEPIQFPTDLKLPSVLESNLSSSSAFDIYSLKAREMNPYDLPLPRIPRRKSSPLKRAASEDGDSSHSAAEEIRSKILFQVQSLPLL